MLDRRILMRLGDGLRCVLPPPQDLPPRLAALMDQLKAKHG
jgi:hypothetical protein